MPRVHPVVASVLTRLFFGVFTIWLASLLVFSATQVLPGDAAYAILGHNASPPEVHALEQKLHLNRSAASQYESWAGGLLEGNPGTSLANGESVWALVRPRLVNSAVLVVAAGVLGAATAVFLGVLAAARKDQTLDTVTSTVALAVTALPEFVVAIALVVLLSTVVFRVLPGVSVLPPGTYAWSQPTLLVLPVTALVIVVVPYIFRMTRAAMIEALESEYVEMAELKGVPRWRCLLLHALPNALPPIIQVIALTFLYLAGGIVIIENAFAYPGIGQGLVNAVASRDVPVIQFIVVGLAVFYVLVNIVADLAVLAVTPRRRTVR